MASICGQCGAKLADGLLDSRCPQCLLWLALETPPAEPGEASALAATPGAKRFGDFELLEAIGRGGMGTVYKARQISLNRTVAIKLILAGGLASAEAVRRFRAEAEAAASLQHPNIVAIHEVGEQDGHPFFAMDYVEGRSLAECVREHPLPAPVAASYLKAIAKAVHYAHQHGILHRDLKPSNVLIDLFDQPRILDFGLAKRLTADADITLSGQTVGSPNFMPPEQAEGRHAHLGPASDVYAMGAMLYHLVTGRPPFQADTLTSLLKQVVEVEPVPPRLLNPGIPRDLETICLKCLEKEPAKRYPTAQALAEDLERFLDGRAVQAHPVGPLGKGFRWCRRQPGRAGLIGAVALVFVLGLAGVLWQADRANRQRDSAQANELLARQTAYAADMNLAQRALQDSDLGLALELLNHYRPQPRPIPNAQSPMSNDQIPIPKPQSPEPRTPNSHLRTPNSDSRSRASEGDLRGWEWRYLWQQCQSDSHETLGRSTNMIGTIVVSPDGKWLASRQGDAIAVWDLAAQREVAAWVCPGARRALAFSPDGRRLAAARWSPDWESVVLVWETSTWTEVSRLPHPNPVGFVAFSPDGKLATMDVGSASENRAAYDLVPGAVRMWDVDRREILGSVRTTRWENDHRSGYGANDARGTLAFSANGAVLAIGESEGRIQLWDGAAGNARSIPAPLAGEGVTTLAFSPDGKLLVAGYGYQDPVIHLYDVDTLAQAGLLDGHKAWTSALAFQPGGALLASASGDQTLRLWDLAQRREVTALRGHTHEVWSVAFSPDGTRLYSGGKDRAIRVWNAAIARPKPRFVTLPEPVWRLGLAFTPDGQTLFTVLDLKASRPLALAAWDPLTGREKTTCPPLAAGLCSVAVSPHGRLLAAGDLRGVVHVWDLALNLPVTNLVVGTNWIIALAFHPSGQRLAVFSYNYFGSSVDQWEVPSWRKLEQGLVGLREATCIDFTPDHRRFAFGTSSGRVSVRDMVTGKSLFDTPMKSPTLVKGVAFLPGGALLASGAHDGYIRLWNVQEGREVETLRGQMSAVHYLGVSPDGRRLASGGTRSSEAVRLWDVATRKDLLTLEGEGTQFGFTGFSPDNNFIVAVNGQMKVQIWRAPSWDEIEAAERNAGGER